MAIEHNKNNDPLNTWVWVIFIVIAAAVVGFFAFIHSDARISTTNKISNTTSKFISARNTHPLL
jgi:hypothetical protein